MERTTTQTNVYDKVAQRWGKNPYLNPSPAELFSRIQGEATDVGSNHWNPEQPKVQNGWDRVGQIVPSGSVISGPVRRVLPGAHESRP